MAGKSPRQAVDRFLTFLQHSLSCVTPAVIVTSGDYAVEGGPYALTVGQEGKCRLKSDHRLTLDIRMQYRIVEASGDRGPYKVTITAYIYTLEDQKGHEIFSYQWHPADHRIDFPHLHLGHGAQVRHPGFEKAHLPTGRVSLEEVLRLLIMDFAVRPLRKDWSAVLSENQARFATYRTWG